VRLTGWKDDEIRLPDRSARVLKGYTILGRQADVVETSRGCTYGCSFCCIIECVVAIFTLILLTA
jgi:anaerobic magnesium-protoporphyrin IX monomethyl ester cyclase